jgi:nucleoside-triphosphatase THEP1
VEEGTPRLLLEGHPGIGQTTVTRRLLKLLQEAGVPVAGFTTGELRTGRSATQAVGVALPLSTLLRPKLLLRYGH